MPLTAYIEKKILDNVFSQVAMPAIATLYVGLSTTTPAGDGTGVTEPSGNAYARVAVTNNATNFPAATGTTNGSKANGTTITFPTATGAWGTVTYVVFYDAAAAGNLVAFGALTTSKAISNLDTASFNASDFTITLT